MTLSVSVSVCAADTANNNESADTANESVYNVPDASGFSSLNLDELGPSTLLQLMYARLQLELSETAKKQGLEMMDQITTLQKEQEAVSDFLNTAIQLQSESKENHLNRICKLIATICYILKGTFQ